ncbi:MAG: trans-2-enoyl-CoA reductase family protein [Kiritimatiellia bacterium]
MSESPKVRGGLCLNVDGEGCQRFTRRDIAREKAQPALTQGPKSVLVLGCSGGYGLASRIVAAFGGMKAETLGVSFERAPNERKAGSPGWYNNEAFDAAARAEGLKAITISADAFADATRETVAQLARDNGFKPFDLVVYSLASPMRTDPKSGILYKSAIKPIGKAHTARTLDVMTCEMKAVSVEPATAEEIEATVKVMGGEDWVLWTEFLKAQGLLAHGCKTVAYSYIGPQCTQDIYRSGTLGKAKENLEASAKTITALLAALGGFGVVSVNKALVTRASAVIPAMPPYISCLFKVMKPAGLHEDCLDQIDRLFRDRLYRPDGTLPTDEAGRIRIDDWEMRSEIQAAVDVLMQQLEPENVEATTDIAGYRTDFLALHGFEG